MEIILKQIETGCIITTSHKLNHDGYFRKRNNGGKEMYHRTIWRRENGDIPNGYEIDHKCKNRACCNIEHLQMLTSSEHRTKDNYERNKPKRISARLYWGENQEVTGAELSGIYEINPNTGCKWIKEWKIDNNLDREDK